ncbi:MAG: hypothetical protein KIH69_020005 [Anaerolineae bacterium]|nr:hypothetical protein [Anaerolineae bacterium]
MMKKETGLWIDHKHAVVVLQEHAPHPHAEVFTQVKHIASNTDSHPRFKGNAAGDTEEDIRDRKYANQLNKFYDEVIDALKSSPVIYVCGPGEAKLELVKRLAHHRLADRVVGVEAADKLTEPQVVAQVHKFFSKEVLH